MIKDKLIFNGNEKQVFSTDDPCMVIFRYKDVTTAFHGVKRARFAGKGILDNEISGLLLGYLNDNGVETHFVRLLGEREQLCRKIEIIPLEVVFHNRISGSLALKLGVEDGFKPANTILDLVFNNDELGDPLINRDQAVALGLATYQELDGMYDTVRRAGKLLTDCTRRASNWWTSSSSSAARLIPARSSSPTRSARIPAACGTRRRGRDWTRTVSVWTSAT